MDLQLLLDELELDVRELKYLSKSYLDADKPSDLKVLLDRNVLQLHKKLDEISSQLKDSQEQIEKSENLADTHKEVADETINNEVDKQNAEIAVVHSNVVEDVLDDLPSKVEAVDIIEEKLEVVDQSSVVLGDRLFSKDDLRKMMSLNDSFRFARELFQGDNELMNMILSEVQVKQTFEEALDCITSKIDISEEDEAGADFILLLRKYFS